MNNPVEISVGKKNTGAANVEHLYCMVQARDRYQALRRMVDMNPNLYGIVFCRTRRETKEVADKLMEEGYNADALHGDLSQAQRDTIMRKFRIKHLQLLVATDVAARGIDVDDLTHIINYNLPDDPEVYIHRTGRTGRVGKKGVAMSLIQKREVSKIYSLEKMVGKEFQLTKVPGAQEIVKKQLFSYIDQVENTSVDEDKISQFLPEIMKKMDWLDKEELLKRFVSLEFSRLLSYYEEAPDLNVKETPARDKNKKNRREKNVRFARFFINQGKKQKMDTRGLLKLINQNMNNRSVEIGKIDVQNNFSFFSIDARYQDEVLKVFRKARFNGAPVEVNLAKRNKEKVSG
jgi:ATP-dependent RNA helicase DeaD